MAKPHSVDDYIDSLPADARPVIERVRGALQKALPKAEETISYSIPAYKQGGRVVIYFAAWKKHYSLYPITPPLQEALGDAIAGYKVSKGTLQFPYTEVKVGLIQKVAKLRLQESQAKDTGKA